MANQTRAQLVSLLNSKVLSGGRRTTAQSIRDFENAIIESLINHLDDVDQNNGYLGIDNTGKVDIIFIKAALPTGKFLRDDGTWQTNTAAWGSISGMLTAQTDLMNYLANKADLVAGKVPASQLPSYVDDVLEFANFAAFPVTGETGKIYIDLSTNNQYRWTGSVYVQITNSSAVWGNISGLISNQTDLIATINSSPANSLFNYYNFI